MLVRNPIRNLRGFGARLGGILGVVFACDRRQCDCADDSKGAPVARKHWFLTGLNSAALSQRLIVWSMGWPHELPTMRISGVDAVAASKAMVTKIVASMEQRPSLSPLFACRAPCSVMATMKLALPSVCAVDESDMPMRSGVSLVSVQTRPASLASLHDRKLMEAAASSAPAGVSTSITAVPPFVQLTVSVGGVCETGALASNKLFVGATLVFALIRATALARSRASAGDRPSDSGSVGPPSFPPQADEKRSATTTAERAARVDMVVCPGLRPVVLNSLRNCRRARERVALLVPSLR